MPPIQRQGNAMSTGTGQNLRMYQPDGGFQESQTGFSIDTSYLRHMDLEHLKCDGGWKIGVGAGSSMIRFYSRAYTEYLAGAITEEQLHAAAEAAGKRIGIRCLAAELLATDFASALTLDKKIWIAGEIAKAGMLIALEPNVRKIVEGISAELPGLEDMMRWFVAPGAALNLYEMQATYPAILLRFPTKRTTPKIAAGEVIASLKSAGQRNALAQLSSLARVRNAWGGRVGLFTRPQSAGGHSKIRARSRRHGR